MISFDPPRSYRQRIECMETVHCWFFPESPSHSWIIILAKKSTLPVQIFSIFFWACLYLFYLFSSSNWFNNSTFSLSAASTKTRSWSILASISSIRWVTEMQRWEKRWTSCFPIQPEVFGPPKGLAFVPPNPTSLFTWNLTKIWQLFRAHGVERKDGQLIWQMDFQSKPTFAKRMKSLRVKQSW